VRGSDGECGGAMTMKKPKRWQDVPTPPGKAAPRYLNAYKKLVFVGAENVAALYRKAFLTGEPFSLAAGMEARKLDERDAAKAGKPSPWEAMEKERQAIRDTRSRERKARRGLARLGHRLKKSRIRPESQHGNDQGGYLISDADSKAVLGGHDFNLTLEQVEAWIAE
jgi:hypothetical protein